MSGQDLGTTATIQRLRDDVSYLASPELDGRAPGTEGHELAASFIEARLGEIRLEPVFEDTGFTQCVGGAPDDLGKNLCAELAGSTERRILIGAHYDHIQGIPGADDNAAAVAIALEVARRLRPWSGQAHLVFAFFDQEEPPYFQTPTMGSVQFVRECPFDLGSLDCAIVMDLCGHSVPYGLCPEALFALGAENQNYLAEAVAAVSTSRLPLLPVHHEIAPDQSDQYAFRAVGAPFLFLSCGRWQHYHSPTDTIDVLDLPKMSRIADALEGLIRRIDADSVDSVARNTPALDFDAQAAKSFRLLTGQSLPACQQDIVSVARTWLASVGG